MCLLLQYLLQSCSRDPSALENIVSQGSQKIDRWPREPRIPYQDLPGFHTADDDDTKTVNIIVKRYVEMPGTLALHVVKGDQDYGSLFGNDVLRGIQGIPRVTVLTHCDNLDKTSKDNAQRLRTTLNTSHFFYSLSASDGEVSK